MLEAIEKFIPTPKRDPNKDPIMLVARSFDVNKPGISWKELKGGVLGGSIIQGKFKLDDEIEIKPGISRNGKFEPIKTKIVGLQKAGKNLEEAGPGGLLGLMTLLDPFLTKSDKLAGSVVGLPGKLPENSYEIEVEVHLLERIVGTEDFKEVQPIKIGEPLLINAWTQRTIGVPISIKNEIVKLKLKIPISINKKEKIVISRQISGRWRLIGYGIVL